MQVWLWLKLGLQRKLLGLMGLRPSLTATAAVNVVVVVTADVAAAPAVQAVGMIVAVKLGLRLQLW